MEILKKQPTVKAPADWFTGDVWFDVVYAGQEPCARTDWHAQAMGQTLHIFMEHLAMWEGTGDGSPETEWLEKVSDEEYGAPRSSTR